MFIQIVFMFLLGVVCTPFTNAQPSFEAFLRSMGHGGGGMQFPSRPSFPEMIDMTSSAGSGSCPYQSHPNKLKFNQMVNNRMITQDCAPGTMFDLSKCSCVNAPSAAPGGGPPVGGDPRMSATGDPNFSQMMSMLQSLGGGSGTPFPSSMDIQPPQMSVPFNPMQMPGLAMPRGLTLDIGTSSADQTLANPIQYKPMPAGTKANSLVDPALLPDVIPPEVMLLLQQAQVAKSREIGKTNGRFLTSKVAVTTTTPSSMGNQDRVNQVHEQSLTGQLPPAVLQMLQQASSPTAHGSARNKETSGDSPVLPQSVLKHLNDISPASFNQALAPHESGGSGIPSHILTMMNQSLSQPELKVPRPLPTSRPSATATPRPTENSLTPTQHPTSQASDGSGIHSHILAMMKQSFAQPESRVPHLLPTPRPSAPVTPRQTGNAMTSVDFSADGNPMAVLLAQLQRQIFGGMNLNPNSKSTSDPFASFISRTQSSISPPAASSVGGPDMAALMSLLGGGGSSSPNGGGNDMFNALMAGSSGGMPGAFPGGPMNLPGVTGTMAGPAPIDMTSFFNEQGQMGAGGGLAGLANINYVRMQDLDRRGVIDLSDLTPAGLAAANAHFSG